MSFEKNMPTPAKKSGEDAFEISVASLKEELASDYKNFKDPNFYFPGGKGELEKKILKKEAQLRSLEGSVIIKSLREELASDYKNFKDPNFHFPGGKSELEKSILEKESKLRRVEEITKTGVDSFNKQQEEQQEQIVPEFDLNSNVLLERSQDYQPEELSVIEGEDSQDEDSQDNNQEGEDREKRGRIFEFIRKRPKLKWAIAATIIPAIGFGIFKKVEGSRDDNKKINEKEIFKPGIESGNSDVLIVNVPDEIIRLKKDELKKTGVDVSKLNPDVLDTILEEVGFISGAEFLESGDGIGVITKTAENGFKNIMPGKTLVNLIDNETGAIYRGQEASSILVHPGDIIIENDKGEYFVIADKDGLNYKKTVKEESKIEKSKGADAPKTTPVEAPSKVSVETPVQSPVDTPIKASTPDKVSVEKPSVLDEEPIDLSKAKRDSKAKVTESNEKTLSAKTSEDAPVAKKVFWKKIFGSRDKKSSK